MINHKIYTLFFLCLSLAACTSRRQYIYDGLMKHVNTIKIIDTHEHQRAPIYPDMTKYNIYALINQNYFSADLTSAGSPELNNEIISKNSLDTLWSRYGTYLNYSMNTSFFKHLNEGLHLLYDYDAPFLTRENTISLSAQVQEKYKNYNAWFNDGFKKINYQVMFLDQFWDPYNCDIDTSHFALVFNVRDIVTEISKGPSASGKEASAEDGFYEQARKKNYPIQTLDDYLLFTDYLFKENIKHNAVCIKSTLAYDRTLYYEDISYDKAVLLFNKAPLVSKEEKKALEDFMFHHVVKKSIEYNLPVQIHTGYFAGNGNMLSNGDPVALTNLFLQYPKAKFVLFHGGYPWTEAYTALGKMFPNVYLDLVWLSQLSKQTAVRTFDEMLDAVPYNKIFMGAGDCQLIEGAVGALQFDKEVAVEVLTDRIIQGSMSEQIAADILDMVFSRNAIDLFKLEKINKGTQQ